MPTQPRIRIVNERTQQGVENTYGVRIGFVISNRRITVPVERQVSGRPED
jgi:hypothetical protein